MRVSGWESRLAAYLENAPAFQWGENDCALWAAKWVAECTGDDHTGEWLGYYRTERGAKIRMTRLGYRGVAAIASAHLSEIPLSLAGRGNLILHPQGSLGICAGLHSHFLTVDGMTTERTLNCLEAWKV